MLEELSSDTKKLEETIAQLKQNKNLLTISIEDLRDDIEDMQALIKVF